MRAVAWARSTIETSRNFHEHQRSIAFAQTLIGRVCLCVIAVFLLYLLKAPLVALPAIVLISFLPERRKWILTCGAMVFVIEKLLKGASQSGNTGKAASTLWLEVIVAAVVILALLYIIWLAARNIDRLPAPVRKHPQICLHAIMWTLLVIVWLVRPGNFVLVLVAAMLPFLLWRCSYLLLAAHRGHVTDTGFADHLHYMLPIWGGTNVPYGKGFDYLSRHRMQSAEDLARSQLAGVKLLLLAIAWKGTYFLMQGMVYGVEDHPTLFWFGGWTLGIPQMRELIAGGVSVAPAMAWFCLYLDIVRLTLVIAGMGHVYVGTLRLCGFNVFRNTYKPLLAHTIVDFWGRFYYYFKELLVDMFFYPTFLRCFRHRPKLRLLSAVFAAAFLGNMYYHLLWMPHSLVMGDFSPILSYLSSYWLYCLLLTAGIYVSMLRLQARVGTTTPPATTVAKKLRRLRGIAGVWTYFSLINIWNVVGSDLTFAGRTSFFLSLFGMGDIWPTQ